MTAGKLPPPAAPQGDEGLGFWARSLVTWLIQRDRITTTQLPVVRTADLGHSDGEGQMVFNSEDKGVYVFDGTNWKRLEWAP